MQPRRAPTRTSPWRRALAIAVPVGLLQAAINQGDHWVHGTVTTLVLAKTIASPLVTISVALASARPASASHDSHDHETSHDRR